MGTPQILGTEETGTARAGLALAKTAPVSTAGAKMEPIFTMLRRVRSVFALKFPNSLVTMVPNG